MQEEWRPVVGYEGLYEVSNLGRVQSVSRVMTSMRANRNGEIVPYTYRVPERIMKQGRRRDGYADVSLSSHGVTTLHCVHRLIAEAWIPNPNNYRFVNHIDLDKTNNSIENLEWVSESGNVVHAVERFSNPQSILIYCSETGQVYASMGQCDAALGLTLGQTWKTIHEGRDYGFTLSIATDKQIREAKESIDACCGWTFSIPKKGRLHPVRKIKCIDTQQEFKTIAEAAAATHMSADTIRHGIRNKTLSCGLAFYYMDDAPEDEQAYLAYARSRYNSKRKDSH